tara:strand:+ start:2345 stop:2773 length:429 start_codon:yes stop_codon:yes gene_type:complete
MTEQIELRTNHNVRVVTLDTSERVLTIFGEIRTEDEEQRVIGYRLLYPYALSLGEVNDDGTIPIRYERWCPYSPVEEHKIGGEHIISVVLPDNGILDNYVNRLKQVGLTEEQIFFEVNNGGESSPEDDATEEPVDTGEGGGD